MVQNNNSNGPGRRMARVGTATAPARRRLIGGFLWPHLRRYRWLLLGAASLNALHGLAVTSQTMLPRYLIDDVLLARGVPEGQRWRRLLALLGLYLVIALVGRMLVWHVSYRLFTYVREQSILSLRTNFFRHVNHLCRRFHAGHQSGELYSYLFGTPLSAVQNYFQQVAMLAPGAILTLVSTLLWVGSWDWLLSGVLLLSASATTLVLAGAQKRIRPLWEDFQSTESAVTGYVAELLRASRDVKLYAMEQKAVADFADRAGQIGRKIYERDIRSHLEWMKNEGVNYACFALLCLAVAWRYLTTAASPSAARMTIGQVQAYLTAFLVLQGPLNLLFDLATLRSGALAGMERIGAVLDTVSTTPEPVGYEAPLPTAGSIVFHDVTFAYEPGRPVLHTINLTIPYGQRVALVGPSGAGKSTITQLLLRFYDPDSGAIRIDGLDIRHCRGPDYRHHFGVVPQDPFIFRTTIRENLCLANPAASAAEIRRACELAYAWEFIRELPAGLDTLVGEGGSTLSGGQRQRLALARALLANPGYFIFDEATSALDTLSERLVQSAVERAVVGRTALMIAHRISTVRHCDRIVVLREGRIVQDGSYEQLVREKGLFHDLVHGQVREG